MRKPQFIKLITRFVGPYKGFVVLNVVCNILSTLFSVFSFAVLIPILQILFKTDSTVYQYQPWSFDGDFLSVLKNNGYYYIQHCIETKGAIDTLMLLAIALVVMTFLKTGVSYLASYFIIPLRTGLARDMRQNMYEKLVDLNLAFYDKQRRGDIMARITSDVQGRSLRTSIKPHGIKSLI